MHPLNREMIITKGTVSGVVDDGRTWVVLYHMETCPHCVMLRPAWAAAKKKAAKAHIAEIEYSNINLLPKSMQQVRGFPTILAVKNKKPIAEYSGDRSVESLFDFMEKYGFDEARLKKSPKTTAAKSISKKA